MSFRDDRSFIVKFKGYFFVRSPHGDIKDAIDQIQKQFEEIKKVGILIDPPSTSTSITIEGFTVEDDTKRWRS